MRVFLTTAACDWLPFPDLVPRDECFEILAALADPDNAAVALDLARTRRPPLP